MAEETHELEEFAGASHDDLSVLNYLLQTVKGISFVSASPLAVVTDDENAEY